MRCPQCQSEDCIEIEMKLKDEDSVKFFSCRDCESKWWEKEGSTIALDEVLELASKRDQR